MSTRITFFVHGTTADNERRISSGWKDVGLSERGVKQAAQLKRHGEGAKFAVVFCSDLKRAHEFARLVWQGTCPIIPDARLRECNYGELNGAPSDIVEPMQANGDVTTRFAGGESYEDVKARIADFLKFLKKDYEGKNVAVVAHKAPQLALDVLLGGKSWEQALAEDWRKSAAWRPGWEYNLQ
ncbi:MAG: histidine phosphatase family protein [Alphaproteobacteria bacterium]|nr:histidine phosphatase family protein [Alphaproteobacteria bacterium]MBV8408309.1 histidine phosphatase family protein [Alphaproteobacteria bacterium]